MYNNYDSGRNPKSIISVIYQYCDLWKFKLKHKKVMLPFNRFLDLHFYLRLKTLIFFILICRRQTFYIWTKLPSFSNNKTWFYKMSFGNFPRRLRLLIITQNVYGGNIFRRHCIKKKKFKDHEPLMYYLHTFYAYRLYYSCLK